ncbi:MAG: hypothetical protein EBR82_25680 [Caulobacteraceae bacterium]|nr:hypothetical protein [Caulobacteraceae bacterium]
MRLPVAGRRRLCTVRLMTSLERNILIFVVVFAAAALMFAGFGGLAPGEGPGRPLMGAGAGFSLIMLFLPFYFGGSLNWPGWSGPVAAAALGGFFAFCNGLYFLPGSSLPAMFGQVAIGAIFGLLAYGRYWFRRRM